MIVSKKWIRLSYSDLKVLSCRIHAFTCWMQRLFDNDPSWLSHSLYKDNSRSLCSVTLCISSALPVGSRAAGHAELWLYHLVDQYKYTNSDFAFHSFTNSLLERHDKSYSESVVWSRSASHHAWPMPTKAEWRCLERRVWLENMLRSNQGPSP